MNSFDPELHARIERMVKHDPQLLGYVRRMRPSPRDELLFVREDAGVYMVGPRSAPVRWNCDLMGALYIEAMLKKPREWVYLCRGSGSNGTGRASQPFKGALEKLARVCSDFREELRTEPGERNVHFKWREADNVILGIYEPDKLSPIISAC